MAEEPAPIFIGGLSRSGKTLLGSMLGSHSRIAVPEHGSNLWVYFYGQFGDLKRDANLERAIGTLLRYRYVVALGPDPERIRAEAAAGPRTYAHLFSLFPAHFAESRGKPRWGEHSGLVEVHADHILAAFPEARFVHMIRDPRDRYAAAARLYLRGRGQIGGATAWWSHSVRLGMRNAHEYPDRYRLLRYEDLAAATDATVRAICEFVGEAFEPPMLEMIDAPAYAEKLRRSRASRGDGSDSSALVSTAHISDYRGKIPAADVAFLEAHEGALMERHGYRLDKPRPGGFGRLDRAYLGRPSQFARLVVTKALARLATRSPWLARRTIASSAFRDLTPEVSTVAEDSTTLGD